MVAGALALFGPILAREWQRRGGHFRSISGRLFGAPTSIGHSLRKKDVQFPAPSSEEKIPVVIVGGGVAGLSAGWWLRRNGFDHFKLLELDSKVGGNAASGTNQVSRFPWGAHYVPIPGKDAKLARLLFEELGVITGYDANGRPYFNDLYLCHDPEERLLINGFWQEGLIPRHGLAISEQNSEQNEIHRFIALIKSYQEKRGADGKNIFSIPIDTSSRDPEYLSLDQITMVEFLQRHDFHSQALHWYVNYCCRDDFGTRAEETSAWAGIHYFAARGGPIANGVIGKGSIANGPNFEKDRSNDLSHAVLTWPEGNGWLVDRLRERLTDSHASAKNTGTSYGSASVSTQPTEPKDNKEGFDFSDQRILTDALVTSIRQTDESVEVDVFFPQQGKTRRFISEAIIFAAPRFIAGHVIDEWRKQRPEHLKDFEYAPWMVANVTLDQMPTSLNGAALAWDNVMYLGESLGYVVATHQSLERYQTKTVLTVYFPLTGNNPHESRRSALAKSHHDWSQIVTQELELMHPGITDNIVSIDTWIWGHGMIRPVPGFIWGKSREEALNPHGRIFFAHSDMSGVSIFEEAQYRGVEAAKNVLNLLEKHTDA